MPNTTFLEKAREDLKDIFNVALKAVSPKSIIKEKVKVKDNTLYIDNEGYPLKENVYLVGFGKAVMEMVIILEEMLGDKLKKGIVSVPKISKEAIWNAEDKSSFPKLGSDTIEYLEGAANNQPDSDSLETTHLILDLVETLKENDTLIVLVTGGGSALLYMPRPAIDQDDKMQLCKLLQNAGATIVELNTVRKKLSLVKGGGLARIAFPASVISLILSDIVGDPIDLIASGPTVYSSKASDEVIAILKKYNLFKTIEGDLKKIIISPETFNDKRLLTRDKKFKHVTNIIIANNMLAIQAAAKEALRKGVTPIILRNDIQGHVHAVSLAYVNITSLICYVLNNCITKEQFFEQSEKHPILAMSAVKVDEIYDALRNVCEGGIVLIGGGESTVVVTGEGKGGRNQELALYFSLDWLTKVKAAPQLADYDVVMLSVGTDGQDGPTDAAGGFGHPGMGPIMIDVCAKLKAMITQHILEKKEKEKPSKETEEKPQEEEELCKRYVLSDYTMPPKKKNEVEEEVEPSYMEEAAAKRLRFLTLSLAEAERMLLDNVLKENDSYNFFSRFFRGIDLVKTGFTGTNVMDLQFVYIKKRQCGCDVTLSKEYKPKDIFEEHDLHIDAATANKYDKEFEPVRLASFLVEKEKEKKKKLPERLDVKIIDENMKEPCCNKHRKVPKVPKKRL